MTDDPRPPDLPTRTEGEGETIDIPEGMKGFTPGQMFGERYRVIEMLGRGGMGEVWHAFDLKLRVEVALKALRPEFFKSERRLEMLRDEVRAAREVVSPNVCRIFDLIEVEGRELVSMEYVDGATLLGVLQERGPLDLKEAQDIASQFLAGLEAIHKAGLIHRDIKPENIMLTRAGRVVVMDFGLARPKTEGDASASGTPAYMAPEHVAGEAVDARADVYSAGVVLAEMVSPDGIKNIQSRQSVWEGVRSEPAKVPDCPWAPVIKRAVARDREQRQSSAHTLIRELEDVTLRVGGAEETNPYPGLASFTEADAEYYYGREAEVEQMWRTLEQPHLLAIIGPSGSGKSSFLRAGLLPARPDDWSCVVATPGSAPLVELAQALVPEFAGDAEAIRTLVRSNDPEAMVSAAVAWRGRHQQVLLVVDQFEELFTLNPPEVQAAYAGILGRLAVEHDVHVLLSMRDDFLFHCQQHEPLRPVFSELTPLGPLVGGALRRALVQPASRCGYRFEDDDLVAEMLAEVEGERGTLPLLAFAVSRLWEERDRNEGLLTREASQRIGGVGGALGRHAEDTLEQIGEKRIPMVREIFRNLVTAQGTRAVRDLDHLLSVFDEAERESATEVLRALVDARLLTTFETHAGDEEPRRRIEIIHESLLANWPRLVRWRAQDQEGAQLRDELRQAARAWDDHGRHDDRLWTGTAYREFRVWRERYRGRLSELEEAFATAMIAFANRRRRRRRLAVAAAFVALLAILAVVGDFWRQSKNEARRASAAEFVALGQLELDSYPTATLAHAIAGLELADSSAARRLALEALWKGPPAFVVNDSPSWQSKFTPNGNWLVQSVEGTNRLRVIGKDGKSRELDLPPGWDRSAIVINPTGEVIFSELWAEDQSPQHLVLWSLPDGKRLAEARYDAPAYLAGTSWNKDRALELVLEGDKGSIDAIYFDGTIKRLGTPDFDFDTIRWVLQTKMDAETGGWFGVVDNGSVAVIEIGEDGLSEPRTLGRHDGTGIRTAFHPRGDLFATSNADGKIRLWDPSGDSAPRTIRGPPDIRALGFDGAGSILTALTLDAERIFRWVWSLESEETIFLRKIDTGPRGIGRSTWDAPGRRFARGGPDQMARMWSLQAPSDVEPLRLLRGDVGVQWIPAFHPRGDILVTADTSGLSMWPLTQTTSTVIRRHKGSVKSVVFDPAGHWLASAGSDGTVRLWPLDGVAPAEGRVVFDRAGYDFDALAVTPGSSTLLAGAGNTTAVVIPLEGAPKIMKEDLSQSSGVAFSEDGVYAAIAGWGPGVGLSGALYVWEVGDWDEPVVLQFEGQISGKNPHFQKDHRILISGTEGLWRADPSTGDRELLFKEMVGRFSVSRDDLRIVLVKWNDYSYSATGRAIFLDLGAGTATPFDRHSDEVWDVALDPAGEFVVTADAKGVIRVGPISGDEPHLLLGHEGRVWSVAIDPLGRWIASGGEDGTVRLWPMPDLSKPPLHTLPREELIAKLKALTNLRVVRDEESSTGWKLTHDPFPGWETVPTW